jgi:glucose/arabinose dehydrogenase
VKLAFLGPNDFLITEKATGQVKHVVDGVVTATVLDLPVNSASERGLLGIALHPRFKHNHWVYLFWSESSTGADSVGLDQVGNPASPYPPGTPQPMGNRVDRFVWDAGSQTLTFDRNIITLRAFQADTGQPLRGNHNGGVIAFGTEHDEINSRRKKHHDHDSDEDEGEEDSEGEDDENSDSDARLYVYIGDTGRRGQMQNLPDGPGCLTPPCTSLSGNLPDDQFGGPEPDNAHLTGVILRLKEDGGAPKDNPFYRAGARRGGEAGANLQKVFAYGIRNGIGMAVDPFTGRVWEAQNGDDTFSELNLVEPGANLGWVQIMGPSTRVPEFKAIETSPAQDPLVNSVYFGLQQLRWLPTNIADSREEALSRLFMVYDGGKRFAAALSGSQEVPPVTTDAKAMAWFRLNKDGTLSYELRALAAITQARASHIHLGARKQNGPVATFLFESATPRDFQAGDLISSGQISDALVIARPGFVPTVANLVERIRQGRAYVNLHTTAFPPGEIRGQVFVTDRSPVSTYSEPEFSWRFEVAPGGVGFVHGNKLGKEYRGNMIVGAARPVIQGGHLFRFKLTGNRRAVAVEDPRIEDRIADNLNKYDLTESESLLFGTGFGVSTDFQTGPNGNLYVVSLSNGAVYEIHRASSMTGK